MTNENRIYSANSYKLALLFWILVTCIGIMAIATLNYFVMGIGFAVSFLGVIGIYSTMWLFRERRRMTDDWSDLK